MKAKESLQSFYDKIEYKNRKSTAAQPHINVFERASCTVQIPYSRRDYYKVTLIKGEGKIEYADKVFEIDKPALLFSNPLIPYAWVPYSEEQEGWFCIFNEAFVKQRDQLLTDLPLFQPGNDHLFFPDEQQVDKISGFFEMMIQENQECYEHKPDVLRSYLHLIIHEGLKMQPSNHFERPINASLRIANLFMELLERQFPIDSMQNDLQLTTARDFATNLSVHVNHLNRSVKEVTGKTTTEHIASRITQEAVALLQHTDWTVSEIAYGLGFETPSYFTNFLKKGTGKSPVMFRREAV